MKKMFFILIMLFISQLGFSQAQNGARITEGYPAICGIHGGTVGQPICVGTGLTYSFIANNSDCSSCGSTTATWSPADCEGMARLVFTP